MYKKITVSLLFILSCFALFSCREQKNSKTEKLTLLLDWLPNPNHVPLYAGLREGVFEAHGIDLEILKLYDCNDTLPYLHSGQADLAIYYMPHTLQAMARGMELKVIGTLIPTSLDGFLVKKTERIPSLKDFKDLVLGNYLSILDRKILTHLSSENAIAFKSVKQMNFDPAAALKSDLVDVVSGICWNIEQSQLDAEGVPTHCYKFSELNIPQYEELIVLSNGAFAKSNPDLIKKFQSALKESLKLCREQEDLAFEHYILENHEKSDQTIEWERVAWNKTKDLYSATGASSIEVWKTFYRWMKENEILSDDDHEIDIDQLFL